LPADIPGEPAAPGHKAGEPAPDVAAARPASRTGRNLPAALGVGVGLGGLAILTLFTVKVTFLIYMAAMVGVALWELSRAVAHRGIRLPVVPVAVGGAAALALAYWRGERPVAGCVAFTVIAILAWRLRGGAAGYLRDVTAGVFALGYLPLMACFVGFMLAAPDGPRRTLVFLILAVCSDVGGYFAGILLGHHPMAPVISPKKTWEGFGGSAFTCLLGGAITVPTLLGGAVWQGILTGLAVLAAATLGDLTESMMKRDLEIKDMGSILPGHGGVLDRLDSLLVSAPVVWLLLLVFIPASQR
jgi:phosphatidate cytidylyltransferase